MVPARGAFQRCPLGGKSMNGRLWSYTLLFAVITAGILFVGGLRPWPIIVFVASVLITVVGYLVFMPPPRKGVFGRDAVWPYTVVLVVTDVIGALSEGWNYWRFAALIVLILAGIGDYAWSKRKTIQ